MFRVEWLFLLQIATGILMVVFLQKIGRMQKQIDEITKEVKAYLNFIEEEAEETPQEQIVLNKIQYEKMEKSAFSDRKQSQEEQQTRLIQEVLGEYFP